mmetsp:Transcript_34533/g.87295  ORF Transcript_34533/g.87295 Transcript_34533/m.87295 type:complete len:273 (-) Transcript_34533:588-1406(-)
MCTRPWQARWARCTARCTAAPTRPCCACWRASARWRPSPRSWRASRPRRRSCLGLGTACTATLTRAPRSSRRWRRRCSPLRAATRSSRWPRRCRTRRCRTSTLCRASCTPTSTFTAAWCTARLASRPSSSPCCSRCHASWATARTGASRWWTPTPRSSARSRTTAACGCATTSLRTRGSPRRATAQTRWCHCPPRTRTSAASTARAGCRVAARSLTVPACLRGVDALGCDGWTFMPVRWLGDGFGARAQMWTVTRLLQALHGARLSLALLPV